MWRQEIPFDQVTVDFILHVSACFTDVDLDARDDELKCFIDHQLQEASHAAVIYLGLDKIILPLRRSRFRRYWKIKMLQKLRFVLPPDPSSSQT